MRNSIAFITSLLAVISLSLFPAHAGKTALWGKIGNWSVYGETATNSCSAIVSYTNGKTLGIMFIGDTATIVVNAPNLATTGQTYRLNVGASTGAYGTLEAIATDDDTVMFMDVNQNTLRALVKSRAIAIQGLGLFDLTGSKKAMAMAWQCYEALNSF